MIESISRRRRTSPRNSGVLRGNVMRRRGIVPIASVMWELQVETATVLKPVEARALRRSRMELPKHMQVPLTFFRCNARLVRILWKGAETYPTLGKNTRIHLGWQVVSNHRFGNYLIRTCCAGLRRTERQTRRETARLPCSSETKTSKACKFLLQLRTRRISFLRILKFRIRFIQGLMSVNTIKLV